MLSENCIKWLISKSRIDRAGDLFREDGLSYTAIQQVQCYRQFRILAVDKPLNVVFEAVKEHPVLVAARLKRLPSIVRKLTRESSINLSQVSDIVGIRIVTENVLESDVLVGELKASDGFHREYDYIDKPRDTGYRGRHLIFRIGHEFPSGTNKTRFDVEVQVRTFFQHIWALVSERFGERVKEGGGPKAIRDYLILLSQEIAKWEEENSRTQQRELGISSDVPIVSVVRVPKTGKPLIQSFKSDYGRAAQQLIGWEEDLSGGDSESLLLVSKGSIKSLNVTHAVFLGLEEVPLADWMPTYNRTPTSA